MPCLASYQVPAAGSASGAALLLGNEYADELEAEAPFLVATLPLGGPSDDAAPAPQTAAERAAAARARATAAKEKAEAAKRAAEEAKAAAAHRN